MKFLIEIDVAGCEGIHRQQVADVLAKVVEHSTITEAISDGLFNSSLFDLSRLAKPQYEDGRCPDCDEPIPDDATYGDACANCEHVFVWGHDEDDEPEGPGVRSLGLADESLRVNVPHLTVYYDHERHMAGQEFYCVDEDHPDDECGRRCPGSSGNRFGSCEEAGQFVDHWLARTANDWPLGKRQGTYVSVWDGGIELKSRCTVDLDNNTIVVHGEPQDVGVDVLEREYITINDNPFDDDGTEYPAANTNDRSDTDTEDTYYYE